MVRKGSVTKEIPTQKFEVLGDDLLRSGSTISTALLLTVARLTFKCMESCSSVVSTPMAVCQARRWAVKKSAKPSTSPGLSVVILEVFVFQSGHVDVNTRESNSWVS